jgi:RecJ-like exonuclease
MMPVIRHLGGSRYEIDSESGATYVLDSARPSCSCPDFKSRRAYRRELCKHLRLLASLLDMARACPECRGGGVVLGIVPCGACNGTGRKEATPV